MTTPRERFDAKWQNDDESGCWIWTGSRTGDGYGQFRLDGRTTMAYRAAYLLYVGPVGDGLDIDHLCRNPSCVNPEHLEPVSHAENVRRGLRGALTTHCPSGHAYTDENTYITPEGRRKCRGCNRARSKANYRSRPPKRKNLTAEQRSERARKAAVARWGQKDG